MINHCTCSTRFHLVLSAPYPDPLGGEEPVAAVRRGLCGRPQWPPGSDACEAAGQRAIPVGSWLLVAHQATRTHPNPTDGRQPRSLLHGVPARRRRVGVSVVRSDAMPTNAFLIFRKGESDAYGAMSRPRPPASLRISASPSRPQTSLFQVQSRRYIFRRAQSLLFPNTPIRDHGRGCPKVINVWGNLAETATPAPAPPGLQAV